MPYSTPGQYIAGHILKIFDHSKVVLKIPDMGKCVFLQITVFGGPEIQLFFDSTLPPHLRLCLLKIASFHNFNKLHIAKLG